MKIYARRFLCLMLAALVVFGLSIPALAVSDDTLTEPSDTEAVTQPEETKAKESTASPEETQAPTEVSEPETAEPDSSPEADEQEDTPFQENQVLDTPTLMTAEDYGVMALASTQNSIMLFDYADNGNYTTVLNYQVSVSYKPNGTGSTKTAYIKNMGWHFARYGGVPYPDDPLYCIEPYRNYAASTSGNSVDRGVTMDGSGSTTPL